MIISNKHGINQLPHELPNDLILRILGNSKISGKSQNFIVQMKIQIVNNNKKLLKIEIKLFL